MIKKLPVFLFILLAVQTYSQKTIYGTIIDSLGVVKNAHIVNLSSKTATFSNDNGEFRIKGIVGDSLRISSVQHKTTFAFVSNINLKKGKKMTIYLTSKVYVLDEITLKKHNLIGVLEIDKNKVPINKRDSLLRKTMDFSNVDMNVIEADDYIDKRVRPPIVETLPNQFVGVGGSVIIPFKNSDALLRKKLAKKTSFPNKILHELGENFFFKNLKIPKEKYAHFITFCMYKNVRELYEKQKILEVIALFTKESKAYLKIIQEKE